MTRARGWAYRSIGTTDLASSAVSAGNIGKGAVTSAKIHDGTIVGADVAGDALTGTQIDESTLGQVPNATNSGELGGLSSSAYQRALSGTCTVGSFVSSVSSNGTVNCTNNSIRPGSANAALGAGDISAHGCIRSEIGFTGLAVNDTAIIVPDPTTWPTGLSLEPLRVDQTNKLPVQICNPTDALIHEPGANVSIWYAKISP